MNFAKLDQWKVAYDVRGSGETAIVFVHGYSADRTHWHHQIDSIDAGRRLVAVDLIGHGESDKPETKYTMDLFARSVAAVLDDVGVDNAVLVGHSNGVPVIRQFCRLYGERTDGLIAVDGALRAMPRERMEQMLVPLRSPGWRQIMEMMVERTPDVAGNVSDEDIENIKRATLATPQHVLLGSAEAMMDEGIWSEEPIDVPLLVLAAKAPFSDMHTDDYQAFVERLAPHVEYHVWDDASHMLPMEHPRRFNALVEEFVGRLTG